MDYITEHAAKFPARQYRKFREECKNTNVTYTRLRNSLESRPNYQFWFAGMAALFAVALTAGFYLISEKTDEKVEQQRELAEELTDSLRHEVVEEGSIPALAESKMSNKSIITSAEIDDDMSDFIVEVNDALSVLSSDTVSETWFLDTMGAQSVSHSARIYELIQKYKEKYPDIPGLEVEYEILDASNKSEAAKLLNQFMQYDFQHDTSKAES